MKHLVTSGRPSASRRTPRTINRDLIFSLVRTKQPISRAELSRKTGLQRSTVSLIVEELIAKRWIVEGEIGRVPRGRRPTMIHLNNQRGVLALDIHPAEMTAAVADLSSRIISQKTFALPADPTKALQAVLAGIRKVIGTNGAMQFEGVGICLPGRVDRNMEKFIFAPRLHWPIGELKSQIEQATGLHVEMDNVANACALAEVWLESSDAANDLVVVNVSEGIGTAVFANGRILRGNSGMAGEFGHVQLFPESRIRCECGNYGCWETMASNTAALRYFHESGAAAEPLPNFGALLELALQGNEPAVEALKKAASYLGRGIRMLVSGLDPREVVIVGDITSAWHLVAPVVDAEVKQDSLARAQNLRPMNHGESGRLKGAVALILSKISA